MFTASQQHNCLSFFLYIIVLKEGKSMNDLSFEYIMAKMNNLLHELADESSELSSALSEVNSDNEKEAKH
jgi:hypothetical protein